MSDTEKVVLIRRVNRPSIHRPDCRHVAGKPISPTHDLVPLTEELLTGVRYGYVLACRTCNPTTGR